MVFLTTFLLETLHDAELAWVVDVLHDEPVDGLFVLSVDSCSFDELALDLFDGLVILGLEVAD